MIRSSLLIVALTSTVLAEQAGAVEVSPAVLEAEAKRVEVLQRIIPSVVSVFSRAGDNGGSGVLISNSGEALTNFHVIAGLGPFVKCGLADGTLSWAVVIGADPTGDLALIRLLGVSGEFREDFKPATIGDSDALAIGDPAIVIGNPFLLGTNLQPTVTYGVVSGVGRYQYPSGTFLEYTECIQTDASINPGNSGGPMFNRSGELIGINGRASFEKRGRVYTGAGYAISINQAKLFLDHLRSGRIVDHGTLGATVSTDRATGRVYVQQVDEASDAARLGLVAGSELVRFGGRPINSANDFKNRLGIYPAHWEVPLTFRVEDVTRRVKARLQPLHTRGELIEQFKSQPFTPPRPDDEETPVAATTANDVVPPEYAALYEAEPGFVNRAANRARLADARSVIDTWGFSDRPVEFRLSGTTATGQGVQIATADRGTAIRIEAGVTGLWTPADEPQDVPPNTGGLLVAWDQLRHFLTDPDAYFTDHIYVGSEPGSTVNDVLDVIETRRGETFARWYVGRSERRLVAAEFTLNRAAVPCEMTFGTPKAFGPVQFPQTVSVKSGGEEFVSVRVDSLDISSATADEPTTREQ